jgi:hypothetical protein
MSNILRALAGVIATVEHQVASILDSGNESPGITLSGGNLIATWTTATTTYALIRSTTSKSAGKWYFESTDVVSASGFNAIGLANASLSMAGAVYLGQDHNGVGWQNGTGNIFSGGAPLGSCNSSNTGFVLNDVLGIAVDVSNSLLWVKDLTVGSNWNNSGAADPGTGVGGIDISSLTPVQPLYVAVGIYATPRSMSVNFGASAFTGSVPSGFTKWG